MKYFISACVTALLLLTAGCAITLRSEVASFQHWPANASGSSYSFKRIGNQEGSLDYGVNTRTVRTREPIVASPTYWHPVHYRPHQGWRPGYWAGSPYCPAVVS